MEKLLSKLGLTQYETATYLTLLRHGTQGAVDIAKRSGVPFGRIYDILYQLELKGFVKVILGKPKSFAPTEPGLALKRALKKKTDEFDELKKETEEKSHQLDILFKEIAEATKPSIWIVRGKENIEEECIRGVLETKKEVIGIVSPDVTTGVAPRVLRLSKESIQMGIKFQFIENPQTKEVWEKVRKKVEAGQKVKILKGLKGFSLEVIDERRFRIEVNDRVYGRIFVIIENPDLAKMIKKFFIILWKQAKSI